MMTRDEVLNKILTVMRNVFADDDLEITEQTGPDDIEDWDSLAQVTILSEVGDSFGLRFGLNDVVKVKTVGDIIDAVINKI